MLATYCYVLQDVKSSYELLSQSVVAGKIAYLFNIARTKLETLNEKSKYSQATFTLGICFKDGNQNIYKKGTMIHFTVIQNKIDSQRIKVVCYLLRLIRRMKQQSVTNFVII